MFAATPSGISKHCIIFKSGVIPYGDHLESPALWALFAFRVLVPVRTRENETQVVRSALWLASPGMFYFSALEYPGEVAFVVRRNRAALGSRGRSNGSRKCFLHGEHIAPLEHFRVFIR